MAYGTVKVDNITFTNDGIDQTVTVSGIVQSISGNITATGTIQGATIIGTSTVSGATVTGNAGVFTTVTGGSAGFTTVTGTTVTGTTADFASGVFTTLTGGVATITSGVFALGAANLPSISFSGDPNTGIYSPGADQLALSTNGHQRIAIDSSGAITIGKENITNAVLNAPESVFINIDSNADDTTEAFVIAANRTGTSGGDELLIVTEAGLVGIGTSDPGAQLECRDSVSAQTGTIVLLNNEYNNYTANGTTAYPVIRLQRRGLSGTTYPSQADLAIARYEDVSSNARTRLDFRLAHVGSTGAPDTTVMSLLSSGAVGIGTTSPAYQLQLATDSAGKPSTITWTIVSDERIKEEIELADLDLCYEAVKNIPLKRFKWKDEVYTEEQAYDRRKLGWIAQDVEAVFPKAVRQHEFRYNQVFEEVVIPPVPAELDDDGNIITEEQPERIEKGELISEEVIEDCRDLNSDQLYAAMYGAIQKLISKVELLEAEVQALKAA